MNFGAFPGSPDIVIAAAAATAIFAAVVLVAWPYLARDHLSARIARIESEKERIRSRERMRLTERNRPVSLRREPKKVFAQIVEQLNLTKNLESGELAQMLPQAGFRGQSAIVTFVAARVISPVVLLVLGAVYVFVLIQPDYSLATKFTIVGAIAVLGYYGPWIYVKNTITKRQAAIRRTWPDALDLLLICVECGMSIESAFQKVSQELSGQCPELAEELSLTTAEISYLPDRRKAYENLGNRTGLDNVKAVVTSLIQSEKYGTPLGQSLRVLAQENRDLRMSEAEKKAASLPPKLTVPMIVFFLPILFAVIITPAVIQIAKLT